MQTPPSTQPDLNQVLSPPPATPPTAAAPPPAPPAPTLITEQQLEGELGNLVRANKPASRGRLIAIIVVVAIVLAAGGYYIFTQSRRNAAEADPFLSENLDSAAPALDSAPPAATTEETSTADLTSAGGRDTERRARLNLFVAAARAAEASQLTLPITTAPVKLNDLASPTVQDIRELLAEQDLTEAEIDGYLLDPSPDSYYFGYEYDGQLLVLTAVLEAGGSDCTLMGDLCVLKRTIDL